MNDLINQQIHAFNTTLPIEEASMPPSSWYASKDILELEKSKIFQHTWQPVARTDELKDSNSYITGVSADIPWVITKLSDGSYKAFYNVCRHKGRAVVCGKGCAKDGQLVCGYHARTFNTDGSLKNAPGIGGIKDFNRDEMGLLPMSLEMWGNWFFINGDKNAPSLLSSVEVLNSQLEARDWKKLKYHSSKEWIINCNWKVYIDNYLDGGYHIPYMHPSLDAQLSMDSYTTTCFDNYSIQASAATKSDPDSVEYNAIDRIGKGSIYAWMFPNFMLNLYGNCLDTNYITPLGPDQCKVVYEFYFLDIETTQAKKFIEQSIEQSDLTQVEDIEICESVQVGMKSGIYNGGRYAPQLEIGEYHFHQLLSQAYLS